LTYLKFYPYRAHEKDILETAFVTDYAFSKGNIKMYKWSGGPKKILVIHGWEGRVTHFSMLIQHLIKAGYTVYGFDAPSHGLSDKVKNKSL
jgi:alpha-beta hydrolase superfamily lysophospholipase